MKANNFYKFVMIPTMILLLPFLIVGDLSTSLVDRMQNYLDELNKRG